MTEPWKARVLTDEEIRRLPRCAIVFIEFFSGEKGQSDSMMAAMKCEDGSLVCEDLTYFIDFEKDMRPDGDGDCWRFWSGLPDEETRKKTPWRNNSF